MPDEPTDIATLIIRLPNREAGRLIFRVDDLQPMDFPVAEPRGYPEPGEAWVRVRIKTSLLPPLEHPLDGDSYYRLDLATLRQAREIRSVPREELIEHARARLDRPRLVADFPFGRREADHTWREAIESGEVAHPIWVEALRIAAAALPSPPPPAFTVRPPGRRRRAVTPEEIRQVRQLTLLVRWELLQAGRIAAPHIVGQSGLFDPGQELRGIPLEFICLHRGELLHEDRDLRQGVLLMLYLLHAAILEESATGKTKPDDAPSELLVQSVAYQPDLDPVTKRLADYTMRVIALTYRSASPENPDARSPAARQQAMAALLEQDRAWVHEHIVLDFFRRHLPPPAHDNPTPANPPPSP